MPRNYFDVPNLVELFNPTFIRYYTMDPNLLALIGIVFFLGMLTGILLTLGTVLLYKYYNTAPRHSTAIGFAQTDAEEQRQPVPPPPAAAAAEAQPVPPAPPPQAPPAPAQEWRTINEPVFIATRAGERLHLLRTMTGSCNARHGARLTPCAHCMAGMRVQLR